MGEDHVQRHTYSPQLRSFALNLNFLSPKAYNYIRQHFGKCLPDTRMLRRWYENLNCKPGFTRQSFIAIKSACEEAKKSNEKLFINIVFDEISIRQHIDWDGQDSVGFVDVGDGRGTGMLAKQILVFMAVCLNRSWKIPVAFFPIVSLTAEQKTNLIKLCCEQIIEAGAELIGITFDGTSVNLTSAKLLGCDIRNVKENTTFKINQTADKLYIVHPDPCHMIKLVRNALADLKVFKNGSGFEIKWVYLEKVIQLQDEEGLHLGNKLRRAHVYFREQKMKVKLAVQTFSKSVADAIDFCRDVLKLSEFFGSEALTDFIRIINDTFDILNTRKVNEFEYKKRALCDNNSEEIIQFAKSAITYICGLHLESGTLLIDSSRKVGFVGIVACLKNIEITYDRLIVTKALKFVPFYKLNQDHIELFFSSVRMNLGRNNNPSVKQFISIYKKLLVRCTIREGSIGNCIPQEQIEILKVPESEFLSPDPEQEINNTVEKAKMIADKNNTDIVDNNVLNQQFLQEHNYVTYPAKLNEYLKHVIHYIAGFVVFKINKTVTCQECLAALQGEYEPRTLIAYKSRGLLQIPSKSVVQICERAETILRHRAHFLNGSEFILNKNTFLEISIDLLQHFIGNKMIFESQLDHMQNCGMHYSALIKVIVKKYLQTRYFFLAKKISEKSSLRQKYNKIIHFKGM